MFSILFTEFRIGWSLDATGVIVDAQIQSSITYAGKWSFLHVQTMHHFSRYSSHTSFYVSLMRKWLPNVLIQSGALLRACKKHAHAMRMRRHIFSLYIYLHTHDKSLFFSLSVEKLTAAGYRMEKVTMPYVAQHEAWVRLWAEVFVR